jgi:hypothetical protein
LNALQTGNTIPDLKHFISELNSIQQNATALQTGAYQQLHVAPQQLVFSRTYQNEYYVIAVNNAAEQQTLSLSLPEYPEAVFTDLLNSNERIKGVGNVLNINLHPFWGRILKKIA